MKRTFMRAICLIVVVALVAGFCVAYAATSEEAEGTQRAYTRYDFYLSMQSGGVTDLATKRVKEAPYSFAYYYLTTITNNTGYPLYINVRDESGNYIVGNAQILNVGQSTPTGKYVYYISGYGVVGHKYRPSGQTSSSSVYGAYIQGEWQP